MKIQHFAIIFIIVILPFSIIARDKVTKKTALLKEQTRYNNIVDNASYDAVAQFMEVADLDGEGKNIPITKELAEAAVDRFFNSLSVNFNLPVVKSNTDKSVSNAKEYFSRYIPAIIIVGYDGLYVYSYEKNDKGYEYVLKPKIPYTWSLSDDVTVNFTLDNYVKIYFSQSVFSSLDGNMRFTYGLPDEDSYTNGLYYLEGYIGNIVDENKDGIDDWHDKAELVGYYTNLIPDSANSYGDNDNPYKINENTALLGSADSYVNGNCFKYALKYLPTYTDNLSYMLFELAYHAEEKGKNTFANKVKKLLEDFGYDTRNVENSDYRLFKKAVTNNDRNAYAKVGMTKPLQDYEYDSLTMELKKDASKFNKLRRETIINVLQDVLTQEFNEHNQFADLIGVTYNFYIPDIGKDQWNNTIDDISILSFLQGVPMGYDTYYNNYSLGGARIVKKQNLYCETVTNDDGATWHKVYHKSYCPLVPRRKDNGAIIYANNYVLEHIKSTPRFQDRLVYKATDPGGYNYPNASLTPGPKQRHTRGVEREYLTEYDANGHNTDGLTYYACSLCM